MTGGGSMSEPAAGLGVSEPDERESEPAADRDAWVSLGFDTGYRAGEQSAEARVQSFEAERDEARFLAEARGAEKDRYRREKLELEARVQSLTERLATADRLIENYEAVLHAKLHFLRKGRDARAIAETEAELKKCRAARAALPVPVEGPGSCQSAGSHGYEQVGDINFPPVPVEGEADR